MKKFFKKLRKWIRNNFAEVFAIGIITDNIFYPSLSRFEVFSLLLLLSLSIKIEKLREKVNCGDNSEVTKQDKRRSELI